MRRLRKLLNASKPPTDYFSLLGVPRCVVPSDEPKFLETLKSVYRNAQMVHHPDKSSTEDLSITLNAAYETLKNPFQRFKHILSIHDAFTEEEVAKGIVKQPRRQAFLMEMFDMNERFDDVVNKSPVDRNGLDEMKADLSEKIQSLLTEAQKKYLEREIEALKELYAELTYFRSLYNRVDAAMSNDD